MSGSRGPSVARARALALGFGAAFALVEGLIRIFDLYLRAPWVDVPSHFLSGAAVMAAILWYQAWRLPGFRPWWSLTGVGAVALAWEAVEILDEIVRPDPPHLQDTFAWDGFWDVISALGGGGVVLLFFLTAARKLPPTEPRHSL